MDIRESLYSRLMNLFVKKERKVSNECATCHGICTCLCIIFKDIAHIINLELLSIKPQADEKMCIESYINAIQDKIHSDGGQLIKPVIAVFGAQNAQIDSIFARPKTFHRNSLASFGNST